MELKDAIEVAIWERRYSETVDRMLATRVHDSPAEAGHNAMVHAARAVEDYRAALSRARLRGQEDLIPEVPAARASSYAAVAGEAQRLRTYGGYPK